MLGPAFDDVLVAAQSGAGWAFARIHEDLAPVVTGYLRQQGAQEPDDVASETFLSAFTGIGGFEGDEQAFRSWLFTIAHRRLVDERRRRGRRPATSALVDEVPEVATSAVEDDVLADLGFGHVGEVVAALRPAQRDVVLLRVVAGLSVAETAAVVGRSEAAVRQLQRRGLRALEARLGARDTAR